MPPRPLRILVPVALAPALALALVLAPRVGSSPGAAGRAECLTPATPDTATTAVGTRDTVVALTLRPRYGAGTEAGLRLLGADGEVSAVGLVLSAGGRPPVAVSATPTPGCFGAVVSPAAAGPLHLTGTIAGRATAIDLPMPSAPGAADRLVARARRATMALRTVHEVTLARPSLGVRPGVVGSRYAGSTVTSRSRSGVRTLRWPGWQAGFDWVSPGLQAAAVVGGVRLGGRRLVLVSGAVRAAPLWMTLAIDPRTGRVVRAQMLGAGHFMVSRYRVP